MRSSVRVVLSLLPVLLLLGCSRVPFTKKIVTENGLKNEDLQDLQYYVSKKVVLTREVANLDSSEVTGHELKTVRGKAMEMIVIKPSTPGVALAAAPGDGVMRIAFEEGDRTIVFRTLDTLPPKLEEEKAIKTGGQEIVVGGGNAAKWDRRFKLASDSWKQKNGVWNGKVTYDGKEWVVEKGVHSYLVIKKTSLRKFETNKKVLPGRVPPEKRDPEPAATPTPAP